MQARNAAALEALQSIGGGTLISRAATVGGGLAGAYSRGASMPLNEGVEGSPADHIQHPDSSLAYARKTSNVPSVAEDHTTLSRCDI